MKRLQDTPLCPSSICDACRDRDRGRPLRTSLAKLYVVPGEQREDFACPFGKPWGWKHPDASPKPSRASMPLAVIQHRRETCAACDERRGEACGIIADRHGEKRASIEHGIRRAALNCPAGKWEAFTSAE